MSSNSTTDTLSSEIPDSRYGLANATRFVIDYVASERVFLALIGMAFLTVGVFYQNAAIARWIGFFFAGYAAVANDSIQTIGTFIASNEKKPWWILWAFIGGLFLATVTYSWITYDGDVSYQRLAEKGFATTPTSFSYLQVAAPIFLLILTRLRMPVSTTFLLLTSFATTSSSVGKVLTKSISGYFLAFGLAFAVWILLSKAMKSWIEARPDANPAWRVAQWVTSGMLWVVWLMQDAANVAVFLPRSMSLGEFLGFAGVIFGGLGLLFFMRGERVQQVVNEKSHIIDVRAATLIDFVYAIILFYFKLHSKVPMSTTWVFIGLLGGREIAMSYTKASPRSVMEAVKLLAKDVFMVGIGLLVSFIIAASVNDTFRDALFGVVGL